MQTDLMFVVVSERDAANVETRRIPADSIQWVPQ
jgi:hypothetical protein